MKYFIPILLILFSFSIYAERYQPTDLDIKTAESLRSFLLKKRKIIKKCLKKDSKAKSVALEFVLDIDKDGVPIRVGVSGVEYSIPIKACIIDTLYNMKYPKPLTQDTFGVVIPFDIKI